MLKTFNICHRYMAKIFQLIDQTQLGLAAWTAALTRSLSPHRNGITWKCLKEGQGNHNSNHVNQVLPSLFLYLRMNKWAIRTLIDY